MSDWQPGDLAVRLPRSEFEKFHNSQRYSGGVSGACFTPGCMYQVTDVIVWLGEVGLVIAGHNSGFEAARGAWSALGFRRVTPHKADEFDREVIELMNREPVNLTSQSECTLALDGGC